MWEQQIGALQTLSPQVQHQVIDKVPISFTKRCVWRAFGRRSQQVPRGTGELTTMVDWLIIIAVAAKL